MSFNNLKELPNIIDSSNNNIVNDFLIPVLQEAIKYDRGVGYFTSGWLKSVADGLIPLVEKGGKIRLITSPNLEKADYEAMLLGDNARKNEVIYKALSKTIKQLKSEFNKNIHVVLAWLVADQILDIKLAIPRKKLSGGDFHVKFGILKDEIDDKVLFMGSYNDTAHANINYEELAIFKSDNVVSRELIKQKADLFQRIWDDEDANIQIMDVPDAIVKDFISLKSNRQRPYKYKKPYDSDIFKEHEIKGVPRDYQELAIKEWLKNNNRGILEMATGSGKTKTSLFALEKLSKQIDSLITIIACPTLSLIDQWSKECINFSIDTIACSSKNPKWKKQVAASISQINLDVKKNVCLVCTHETLKNNNLKVILDRILREEVKLFLIADECHHLGSIGSVEKIYKNYDFTLGLSATPDRFFDEEGTKFITSLLGEKVFSFTLGAAIKNGFLCPYEYHVHKVYLTASEIDQYNEISDKIKRLINRNRTKDKQTECKKNFNDDSRLKALFNLRAKIIKTAEDKLSAIELLLKQRVVPLKYAIFFCAPDTKELDKVSKLLNKLDIISHRFTGCEEPQERQTILHNFEKGIFQALTAMNIFNEGIDVPFAKEAFILSSSSNPTEYIQRRGRVLRKAPGINKDYAIIHDFIAMPPQMEYNNYTIAERQIVKREIDRSYYFAEDALNGLTVMDKLREISDMYLG